MIKLSSIFILGSLIYVSLQKGDIRHEYSVVARNAQSFFNTVKQGMNASDK